MGFTPSSWTFGGAGSSESGRIPLFWEDEVERNLDLVVKKGRRTRVVGAATARRGANAAVRVVEVRMPRPTRPAALDNDCLVILSTVSGTIDLGRERRKSLAMLLKNVSKEEALRVDECMFGGGELEAVTGWWRRTGRRALGWSIGKRSPP